MTTPPKLTDRNSLNLFRQRAVKRAEPAFFLHQLAADEIHERLELVNRPFTAPAVVSGYPDIWAGLVPGATHVPDDDTLHLEPSTYDLVIHAMSLHWSNDLVGQLVQCRRALKPDGLFLGVLLGGQTLTELRAVLGEAEIADTGGLSPRVAPMAEIRDLGALLQRAGFTLPVADSSSHHVSYRDLFHLISDLRGMGETNALSQRQKHTPKRTMFARAATAYQAHFPTENNRIQATFETVFLTGWAPDASQPQALRPGSAKARLADALGTSETGLIPTEDKPHD